MLSDRDSRKKYAKPPLINLSLAAPVMSKPSSSKPGTTALIPQAPATGFGDDTVGIKIPDGARAVIPFDSPDMRIPELRDRLPALENRIGIE